MDLRKRLKDISFIYKINSTIKALQLKHGLNALSKYYSEKAKAEGVVYSEEAAIEEFRRRHQQICPHYIQKRAGRLNIFFVGASQSQDESGFIQALKSIGDVSIFSNELGGYGLLTEESGLNSRELRVKNSENLECQFKNAHKINRIDFLIGQMWAHYYSIETLRVIREKGVPIINISMDDRLPIHWSTQNSQRMGSVGLRDGVDMVLTTASETCEWYETEKIPSMFWPLASAPQLFSTEKGQTKDIDVLFIGNRYGIRGKIVDYLIKNNISVNCYGNGWANGYVNAEKNINLSKRAKIILGVGTVGYASDVYTLKLRDFDALMTGALYITHRNADLVKLFTEGHHIEYYSEKKELLRKIKYYLSNQDERIKIGKQGKDLASKTHNWDHRLRETFVKLNLMSI